MADNSSVGISHLGQRRDWSSGDGLNWGWHLVGASGPERVAHCAGLRRHKWRGGLKAHAWSASRDTGSPEGLLYNT